jgi:hypothetical protein
MNISDLASRTKRQIDIKKNKEKRRKKIEWCRITKSLDLQKGKICFHI